MKTPSIDYDKVVERYMAGDKISDIAEEFSVVPDTIEHALRTRQVTRNRLHNPEVHSQSVSAISSRLYRARRSLEWALEHGSEDDIRRFTEDVTRERGLLEQANNRRKASF